MFGTDVLTGALSGATSVTKVRNTRFDMPSPQDLMGMVLCDADLDYLGTEDYEGPANQLRDELTAMHYDLQHGKWLDLQINFLEGHHFFTAYAREHRDPQKQLHLRRLRMQKSRL